MDERKLRAMVVGLALFRAFLGLLLIGMPWIVGNGVDGYGATAVGCGVAVVAAGTQMHRAPWLRWVQASLAFAVFFAPFAFPADDISDRQIYYAVLVGHMLLISAVVTPRLFASQEPSERTSASDDSRSAGSKTSSVTTPPN